MKEQIVSVLAGVRAQSPLVHAITNYVTIGDCANILLAFGASPAMCEAVDETFAFAQISGAFYLNLGTLTQEQELAAYQAVLGANKAGSPVVVDPAGCGAIPRKHKVMEHLNTIGHLDLIKGNGSEIKALAGMQSNAKGVDSGEESGLEEACAVLAAKYGCTVMATGKVDLVSDGVRTARVQNGVELLTKITGAGCMLGALCAATAAVSKQDLFVAATAAAVAMGVAGELAYEQAKAPGSFRVALMDAVYLTGGEDILQRGRVEC